MTKERFDEILKEEGALQIECDEAWEVCPFNRDTLIEEVLRAAALMNYGGTDGNPSRITS